MTSNWTIFETPIGQRLRAYLLGVSEILEKELQDIHDNALPNLMDEEHLLRRAEFLGVLHFENELGDSFRDRVRLAYFWWLSAGTMGQFRRTLSLIMRGAQRETWDYISGRESVFEIGRAVIGETQVGDEGYFEIRLLKPTASQLLDVQYYCDWAIAPYLEYSIIPVEEL